MEPKWLQNGSLEASGRPLGANLAPGGSPEAFGEALGRLLGPSWRLWGTSWGLLGRSWGSFWLPGEAPGGNCGTCLQQPPAARQKLNHIQKLNGCRSFWEDSS